MAAKKIIQTDQAPAALGPYSQAVIAEDTVYISGQIGIDPAGGNLATGGTADQARQALKNIEAILKTVTMEMSQVVQVQIFLTDMEDFHSVNKVYKGNGTVMFFFPFADTLTTCTTDFCFFVEH